MAEELTPSLEWLTLVAREWLDANIEYGEFMVPMDEAPSKLAQHVYAALKARPKGGP